VGVEWPRVNRILCELDYGRRPILVCGHARSGTSWILRTLGRAPEALVYPEPFLSTCGETPATLAGYVPTGASAPGVAEQLDAAFAGLITTHRHWRAKSPKLARRILGGFRVVIKEVATLMYIEWVAERYDPVVLIPVRHPCPVVLSQLDRGNYAPGWLNAMLGNERLMADHLEPFRAIMEGATSPLEATAAQWAGLNRVMATQLERHPDWLVVPYEPLARDPIGGFRALYDLVGLRWTRGVQRYVTRNTTTPDDDRYTTTRVSADRIDAWRQTMTVDEVARVRAIVEPFDLPWYRADEGAFDKDYSAGPAGAGGAVRRTS